MRSDRAPLGLRIAAFAGLLFLHLPILVMVGARDLERDAGLRRNPQVDRRQGLTRVERAARWATALRAAAVELGIEPQVAFRQLPACGHSFADCVARGGLVGRTARWLSAPER